MVAVGIVIFPVILIFLFLILAIKSDVMVALYSSVLTINALLVVKVACVGKPDCVKSISPCSVIGFCCEKACALKFNFFPSLIIEALNLFNIIFKCGK